MTPPLRRAHCAVSQNGVAHCANPIIRVIPSASEGSFSFLVTNAFLSSAGTGPEAVRAAVEGKDVEMEG